MLNSIFPDIPPVVPHNIPALLKRQKRWLGWWAGPLKPNGKFDKFPVDPMTGRKINPVDPINWLTFEEAMDAHRRDMAKGIGFVLSDRDPIVSNGNALYLTAIDLDHCGPNMTEHEQLWLELGKPYVEVSPSRKGLRMLSLSLVPLKGGNAGNGRELYSSGRFMTITGVGAQGALNETSAALASVERRWFPANSVTQVRRQLSQVQKQPETHEHVANVLSMLDAVSSDTTYEIWRDIIWSLASTAWACARQVAHQWSRRAHQRYDGVTLDKIFDAFDVSRGLSLATLAFHARKNGWSGSVFETVATNPLPLPLLMTAEQLRKIPGTPYVIRSVFPARGLAAIYGEPGSGKSFLALHLAHAIAAGVADWFGFRVRQMPVVYVALEGLGGIGGRTTALEMHSKQICPNQLRFWCRDIHLVTGDAIDLLASEIVSAVGQGAVVIVDTLNQASPGADENSSQDMGRIIANSKRLAASAGGLVILVHHAGKNRSLGLRGHSSLLAAMDAVIEVTKAPTGKRWAITKAKDESSDVVRDFELVRYDVGQDDDGTPITSCAVQHTIHSTHRKVRPPTGKHQKMAIAELRRQLQQPGRGVDYKTALALVAAALDAPQGKKGDRAKEALEALLRDGHLVMNELGVSLA